MNSDIAVFWSWFAEHASRFGDKFQNRPLLDELDGRVSALGPVGWEVGPGFHHPEGNALAISPRGNAELLPLTRTIVAQAPDCPGWEFHAALPPKVWKRTFVLEDSGGPDIRVDASAWRYLLLRFPDGIVDIVLKGVGIETWSEEVRASAATVLVMGELGEELFLTRVHVAELVSAFEDGQEGIPIVHLRDHVLDLR